MSLPKVALETLGCKVNQYESSYFLEVLKEAGYQSVSFREHADIYIVHSCAVTSRASYQTRQLLRRAQRINPQATIVAAGCDAQFEPDCIANERLATHILGSNEKFHLIHWLKTGGSLSEPCRAVGNNRDGCCCAPLAVTRMHSGRARSFLKVQDGCDSFCSYCIVPYTRGRSRSLPTEDVRRQMDRFIGFGYQEVVLTGIHLGQWGRELAPAQDFGELLTYLAEGSLPHRIRLSSLEPMEWTGELIGRLASWPWLCPHFHVPLQSGDSEILYRMHRPYAPRHYAELIQELHLLFPDGAYGADVLVGFPGETDRHFENTFKLITELPLTYLHVFPFSPRSGTQAATLGNRVTDGEVKRRARSLRQLGMQKKEAFRRRSVGKWVEVLAESKKTPGWWQGTSDNYLTVVFHSSKPLSVGSIVRVRLTELTDKGLIGMAEDG
jgi:threonylcarbamoyladenosine tRNA methylthiotransferase MtaB